jgi:hypothetical protein
VVEREEHGSVDRRAVLRSTGLGAVAAGVTWVAPTILSVDAAAAATVPPVAPLASVVGSSYLALPTNGTRWVDAAQPTPTMVQSLSPATGDPAYTGNDIAGAGGTVAIGATGGTIVSSTDNGTTWARENVSAGIAPIQTHYGVAVSPGQTTVAVGDTTLISGIGGRDAFRHPFGGSWGSVTLPGGSIAFRTWYDVEWGNNLFVAVGDGGRYAFSSDDGSTWGGDVFQSGVIWRSITYDAITGLWWMCGTLSSYAFSSDPTAAAPAWTYGQTGASANTIDYDGIDAHNGTIIMVGQNGVVSRSTNGGGSWNNGAGPAGLTNWNGAATNGSGDWTICGDGGTVAVSGDDGLTWTGAATPSGVPQLNSAVYL